MLLFFGCGVVEFGGFNQMIFFDKDLDNEKWDDNWPENSLEYFIWIRCEADNCRVREIMKEIYRRMGYIK